MLAASVLYLFHPSKEAILARITGYNYMELQQVIAWLTPLLYFPRWERYLLPLQMSSSSFFLIQEHIPGVLDWVKNETAALYKSEYA